jgi:hypothetical protein
MIRKGDMMIYELWEKKTVYLVPAQSGAGGVPTPPIYYPPGIGIMPPIYHPIDPGYGVPGPPGFWPGTPPPRPGYPPGFFPGTPPPRPGPQPPIMMPPIYYPPGKPPGYWGGSEPWPGYPMPPIAQPPTPPNVGPLPPDIEAPPEQPTGLPDFNSPGYNCIFTDASGKSTPAWVQIAFITSEGHEPKNPVNGLPGKWVKVYGGFPPTIADAWIPTPEEPPAVPAKK